MQHLYGQQNAAPPPESGVQYQGFETHTPAALVFERVGMRLTSLQEAATSLSAFADRMCGRRGPAGEAGVRPVPNGVAEALLQVLDDVDNLLISTAQRLNTLA